MLIFILCLPLTIKRNQYTFRKIYFHPIEFPMKNKFFPIKSVWLLKLYDIAYNCMLWHKGYFQFSTPKAMKNIKQSYQKKNMEKAEQIQRNCRKLVTVVGAFSLPNTSLIFLLLVPEINFHVNSVEMKNRKFRFYFILSVGSEQNA